MTKQSQAAQPVPFILRMAQIEDAPAIEWLDTFGTSPHRNISRDVDKYFGSVDPSVHERNLIFLAELPAVATTTAPFRAVGKAELLLAPTSEISDVGYIKRVVVHPRWRKHGVARAVLEYVMQQAPALGIRSLDLHVWDGNTAAVKLYESLGFALRHRELYLRLPLDGAADANTAPIHESAPHDEPR
jgi:ribosomal protein S18 acetylase RimI-like enzyme